MSRKNMLVGSVAVYYTATIQSVLHIAPHETNRRTNLYPPTCFGGNPVEVF